MQPRRNSAYSQTLPGRLSTRPSEIYNDFGKTSNWVIKLFQHFKGPKSEIVHQGGSIQFGCHNPEFQVVSPSSNSYLSAKDNCIIVLIADCLPRFSTLKYRPLQQRPRLAFVFQTPFVWDPNASLGSVESGPLCSWPYQNRNSEQKNPLQSRHS